jgi:heme-degrading monooxygenase HmoA
MIARIWRGVTREADKDIYYQYLQETGLPDYRATKGNLGERYCARVYEGKAEFVLTTYWESYEAIRAFGGPDYEKAVYYPEDRKFLLELDPHVKHYEVLVGPNSVHEATIHGCK